ncbi:MAG: hypothetical protein CMJ49_07800 [Planctomycetaceae bacterium]|nr:hypothetical protein [Planctomycetaceae bacterium]
MKHRLFLLLAACLMLVSGCTRSATPVLLTDHDRLSDGKRPVTGFVSSWFPHSHPEVMLGRIIRTYSNDGKGEPSQLYLASLYVDFPRHDDMSAQIAADYDVRISPTMEDALTLGTGELAVGGVIICDIWQDYPYSRTNQMIYPHRKFFDAAVDVMQRSGKVAPVFVDAYLADNWEDSWHIYSTAKELGIPLMAGSSVPVGWRQPKAEIPRGAKVKEIVAISYHTTDLYGFHGMEMIQTLAERRAGGETGVASVQCLTGQAIWDAEGKVWDRELLADALARNDPPRTIEYVKENAEDPTLFIVNYVDGTRASMFCLNYSVLHWAAAWRYEDGTRDSTMFWLHEEATLAHFARQVKGIEKMILTGTPAWPVERTLLTSGMLHAGHLSKVEGNRVVETPYMSNIKYTSDWEWTPLAFPDE